MVLSCMHTHRSDQSVKTTQGSSIATMSSPKILAPSARIRKLFFLLLLLVLLMVLFWNFFSLWPRMSAPLHGNQMLVVDTPMCQIPELPAISESVRSMILDPGKLECDKKKFSLHHGSLSIKVKPLLGSYPDITKCQYKPIQRKEIETNDKNYRYGEVVEIQLKSQQNVLHEEFIKIECLNKNGAVVLEDYLQQASPALVENVAQEFKEIIQKQKGLKDNYNVVMIGIDSTSRLQAHRHLKKTMAYLKTELKAFELDGYNRVGDNTFLNIVPLLFGQTVEELGWNSSLTFDSFWFPWKELQKRGYASLYSEDSTNGAIFNYAKKGFLKKPAKHYLRPYMLALQDSKNFKESVKKMPQGKWYCAGPRKLHEEVLDFTKQFMNAYHKLNIPFFAFSFITYISHDYINDLGQADEDHLNFLKQTKASGALDNTLLIYYGDHGFRYGKFRATEQGRFEENLPYIQIALPKKFADSAAISNLMINKNRLTTPFDVHKTICEVVNLQCAKGHGVSLLHEISTQRTCPLANIPKEYCSCGTTYEISATSIVIQKAAIAIISSINSRTAKQKLCIQLSLDVIKNAYIRSSKSIEAVLKKYCKSNGVCSEEIWAGIHGVFQILLTIKAKPAGGEFQATVDVNLDTKSFTVQGDISRVNLYGNQSACIKDDFNLKKFCLCKT